jgi:hypothetical protein
MYICTFTFTVMSMHTYIYLIYMRNYVKVKITYVGRKKVQKLKEKRRGVARTVCFKNPYVQIASKVIYMNILGLYVHILEYTYVHKYTHIYIPIYIHICVYIYMCIYIYVYIYVCTYTFLCIKL